MDDTPSFHKTNLRHAAQMEQGRKQILDVLCGNPATLQVLAQDYAAIKPSGKSVNELVHVHAHRFADDDDMADGVIRNRAERVAKRCLALSMRKTVSIADRRQLVDEMYDIRLPDKQMATVPDRAVEAEFCTAAHARRLELLISGSERHVREARTRLIEANLPLLRRPLYGYHERPDFQDIQSEGKLGLIDAADRWDHRSRLRFSTYAVPYIAGYASLWIQNHGSTMRVPTHRHAELNKLHHAETRHLAEHGEIPPVEILAKTLGMEPEKIQELRTVHRDDRPYEHPELYDVVWRDSRRAPEPHTPEAVSETVYRTQRHDGIRQVLRTLTPREERVMKERFGLDGEDEKTFSEIASSFQVSGTTISKIHARAVRKLRNPARASILVPLAAADAQIEKEGLVWTDAAAFAARRTARAAQDENWLKNAQAEMVEAHARETTARRLKQITAERAEAEQRAAFRRQARQDANDATALMDREQLRDALADPHARKMLEDPRLALRKGSKLLDLNELTRSLGVQQPARPEQGDSAGPADKPGASSPTQGDECCRRPLTRRSLDLTPQKGIEEFRAVKTARNL